MDTLIFRIEVQDAASSVLSSFEKKLASLEGAFSAISSGILGVGSAVIDTFVNMGSAVADFTGKSIDVFGDFEQGMKEIKKSAGGSEEELKKLGDALRDAVIFDLKGTKTVEELQAIAAAGGKLGVAAKDLDTFSVSVAKMSDMWGLTEEKTAQSTARIIAQYELLPSQIENIGSAVDGIADSFATSEAFLLNWAQRMSGDAKNTGQTFADILAIGAQIAVKTGANAEAASSAYSDVLQKMLSNYEGYAKSMGISSDKLKTLITTDGAEAFNELLLYLERVKNAEGPTGVISALEDLGISSKVTRRLLLGMVGSVDENRAAMAKANQMFAEGTRISKNFADAIDTQKAGFSQWGAVLEEVSRTYGEVLAPSVDVFLQLLANQVIPVIMQFIQWLKTSEEATKFFSEALPAALTQLATYFQTLATMAVEFLQGLDWSAVLQTVTATFQTIIDKVGEWMPVIITFFTETLPNAITTGFTVFSAVVPILNEIAARFVALLDYIEPIKEKLSELFNAVLQGDIQKVAETVSTIIKGILDKLVASIRRTTDEISPVLSGMVSGLSETLKAIIDVAVLTVKVGIDNAIEFFSAMIASIDVTPLKNVMENIGFITRTLVAAIDQLFGKTKEGAGMFTTLGAIAGGVLNTIIDLIAMATQGWANIATWFSPEVWRGVGEELVAWWERAMAKIEEFGGGIITFLLNPLETFGQAVASVFSQAIGWIGKTAGYVLDLGAKLKGIIADLVGIDDTGVQNSTWPDMYTWVGKNIKSVEDLQGTLSTVDKQLKGMKFGVGVDMSTAYKDFQRLTGLQSQLQFQAGRADISAPSIPGVATSSGLTPQSAQTPPASSNGSVNALTINFQGTNIVDERSRTAFAREIGNTLNRINKGIIKG